MKRPLLNKDLGKTIEFIVEYKDKKEVAQPKAVSFTITPESLQNVKDVSLGLVLTYISIQKKPMISNVILQKIMCSAHLYCA